MRELVEYIAKSIAAHPDEVQVTEESEEGRIVVRLKVSEEDKGRIIGRQGRVAQSIRMLMRVTAVKQDVRAVLEIV